MILFGKNSQENLSEKLLNEILAIGAEKKRTLRNTPIETIVETLHAFGQQWQIGGKLHREALAGLKESIPFSEPMLVATLGIIPDLLNKEALLKRVKAELGSSTVGDGFEATAGILGKVRAFPLGEVLHVTAGNVFISCIDSLVMGFLTKNICYLKLSSKNQFFPFYFAQKFFEFDQKRILADKFCMLTWKGGDTKIESIFKQRVPAIIAWGGEEMLSAYRQGLGMGTKLLDYGPKISFQVITLAGLAKLGYQAVAELIAYDLMLWDQQACSSPQNLFIEDGADIPKLFAAIGSVMESDKILPRGNLSADEAVEILKEEERARVSRLIEGGHSKSGKEYLLHYETRPFLRTSPLNRTLVAKGFKNLDDLIRQIAPFRFYLQSCGFLTGPKEKPLYVEELGACGIKRFAPLGKMGSSFVGLPHDGRYGLRELVEYVTDEAAPDEDSLVLTLLEHVPYYKNAKADKIADFSMTNGSLIAEHEPATDRSLLDDRIKGGRFFASGGSSGKPKHVFYSNDDFERTCAAMVENLRAQELPRDIKAANLFAAGTLYSSFLAVDRYCEMMGITQLPIGGLAPVAEIVRLLAYHKPQAVFGLPSLIMNYARYAEEHDIKLNIPWVIYAGEHLPQNARDILRKQWGSEHFGSAGYASVDAGLIGYQCKHCEAGVHHLFADEMKMEIIDGEAVVTSFLRLAMPVVRYRTGDHVEWLEGDCDCGRKHPRFKLLGRVDGQINVWACRVQLIDIEAALKEQLGQIPDYQLIVTQAKGEDQVRFLIDGKVDSEKLKRRCFELCKDLKQTLDFSHVNERLHIEQKTRKDFVANERTGKTPRTVDQRSN